MDSAAARSRKAPTWIANPAAGASAGGAAEPATGAGDAARGDAAGFSTGATGEGFAAGVAGSGRGEGFAALTSAADRTALVTAGVACGLGFSRASSVFSPSRRWA